MPKQILKTKQFLKDLLKTRTIKTGFKNSPNVCLRNLCLNNSMLNLTYLTEEILVK